MSPFRFRKFEVEDNRSTMKVGTDAVLLGAWCKPPMQGCILDVGTGCGILALMMAQRTAAAITAIDIDADSIVQARENVERSPWHNRIRTQCVDFTEYAIGHPGAIDYVVSNPPFFINCLRSSTHKRNMARHAGEGFIENFSYSLSRVLTCQGKAAIIIPYSGFQQVTAQLKDKGLILLRECVVFSRDGKPATRLLLEIGKTVSADQQPVVEHLICRDRNNAYTTEYLKLTSDFYPWVTA